MKDQIYWQPYHGNPPGYPETKVSGITAPAMKRKTKPICPHCGSDDIGRDAWADWDEDSQTWVLRSTYDTFACLADDCGKQDIEPEWVEVQP